MSSKARVDDVRKMAAEAKEFVETFDASAHPPFLCDAQKKLKKSAVKELVSFSIPPSNIKILAIGLVIASHRYTGDQKAWTTMKKAKDYNEWYSWLVEWHPLLFLREGGKTLQRLKAWQRENEDVLEALPKSHLPIYQVLKAGIEYMDCLSMAGAEGIKAVAEQIFFELETPRKPDIKAMLKADMFIRPLETASGQILSRWGKENGKRTIEAILHGHEGVRDAFAKGPRSLLAAMRALYEREIDQVKASSAIQKHLEETIKHHRYKFRKAYQSALSTVRSESDYKNFVRRAREMDSETSQIMADDCSQQTEDIVDLFIQSTSVQTKFSSFMEQIANNLKEQGGNVELCIAPPKSILRAYEKTGMRPLPPSLSDMLKSDAGEEPSTADSSKKRWSAKHTLDVVRGALIFRKPAMGQMLMAMLYLETSPNIEILRVKDRFSSPTNGGWADALVNLRFRDDPHKHVCELQLSHDNMHVVREKMGAHRSYDEFRVALELLEANGLPLPPPEETEDDKRRKSSSFHLGEMMMPSLTAIQDIFCKVLDERLQPLHDKLDQIEKKVTALEALK